MANVEKGVFLYVGMIIFPRTLQELVSTLLSSPLSIAIKIYPGAYSKGIFINLKHYDDEEYQLTHPSANVTGFISLKVHPYVTVQDQCVVTCPKTKLKALLKYTEEV